MTKPEADELVDDYEEEVNPASEVEDEPEPAEPQWRGGHSKIALAPNYVVDRDHVLVDSTSECLDCLKANPPKHTKDHQFHIKASKINGTWVGPEASTRQALKQRGGLRGTREAENRLEQQRQIDLIRGVDPSTVCRVCGGPLTLEMPSCPRCESPNGLASLKALTLKRAKANYGNAIGAENALQLEAAAVRDEIRELRQVISPITELVTKLAELEAAREAKGK